MTATGIPDFGDGFRPVLLCASVCQLALNNTVHDIGPNLHAKDAAHSHRHVSGNLQAAVQGLNFELRNLFKYTFRLRPKPGREGPKRCMA